VFLSDHVAEVDADANSDAAFFGEVRIAFGHRELYFGRTAHGIDDALELRQQPVPGILYGAAPVLADLRLNQLPKMGLEPFVRSLLIRPHQARIPRHVGG
jgi:hypothetical protein